MNADVANRQISATVNLAINENVMNMYELLGQFEEAGVSGAMVNAAGQTLAEQLSVSAEAVRQDLSAFADKVRR